MLMPKDPTSLDAFTADFTTGVPYTMFKGNTYAHLMVPLPNYYDYSPAALLTQPSGKPASVHSASSPVVVFAVVGFVAVLVAAVIVKSRYRAAAKEPKAPALV